MARIDEKEQCIALTNKGDRCSRIAKDGRFCFQHDQSSPTIENSVTTPENILTIVSNQVDLHAEQLTGVQRDLAQNVEDVLNQADSIQDALTSFRFTEAVDAFRRTVSGIAPTPAKYGMVGGVLGSPGGPIGAAAGTTGGVWYGIYKLMHDNRAVRATVIDTVPEDAEVVPSNHSAIHDVQPIQLALKSAIEKEEDQTEWLRTTLTRERNMDEVEQALQEIPLHRDENGATEYYIQDQDSGRNLLLIFGTPLDEE